METKERQNRSLGQPVVLVSAIGAAEGVRAAAAALACAASTPERASILIDLFDRPPPRPTLLTTSSARGLANRLSPLIGLHRVAARGRVCFFSPAAEEPDLLMPALAVATARQTPTVLAVPQDRLEGVLREGPTLTAALLRADIDVHRDELTATVHKLSGHELSVGVLEERLRWPVERRALFGLLASDDPEGFPTELAARLLKSPTEGSADEIAA